MVVRFGLRLVASLLAAAATLTSAAPPGDHLLRNRAVPPLPSTDNFYDVPGNLEDVPPGSILKHRPPPNPIAAFGVSPVNLKSSHQILYRTTDSLGKATATVLTVLIPHNADYTKVLSYQTAEDASNVNCAPSYAFQFQHDRGPGDGTILTELELLLIEAGLEQGWVVISPDYVGHDAAFLANRLAGQATLDGIRAALNSGSFTGISKNPTVTMWGYSGGSTASVWAAELQPSYAPELVIAGAAVGGTVPNITTVVTVINKTPSAGLIPAGIIGLTHQYADLRPIVGSHLLPQYRDKFYEAGTQCIVANTREFENEDIVGYFDDRTLFYTNPTVQNIISANNLGKHTPQIPLFVYKAVQDEVSPVGETDDLVENYCSDGANVEYKRDLEASHGDLAVKGAPRAIAWLIKTMKGRNHHEGCTVDDIVSSPLDPQFLPVLSKFLLDTVFDLLGKTVGPLIG